LLLTRAQFAQAARADEKWVENTAHTTRRPLSYSPAEARWFGIVRALTRDFAVSLRRAAELADLALQHPATAREAVLAESSDRTAALTIDLAREHSSFAAALSAALQHGGPRRRGRQKVNRRATARRAIAEAERHGVDVTLLKAALEQSPAERLARLDANAAFVRAVRSATPKRRHR
jgi:hypothetical protein